MDTGIDKVKLDTCWALLPPPKYTFLLQNMSWCGLGGAGEVWMDAHGGRGGSVAVSASGCDLYMYMLRAVGGCWGAVGVGLSHACVVRGRVLSRSNDGNTGSP